MQAIEEVGIAANLWRLLVFALPMQATLILATPKLRRGGKLASCLLAGMTKSRDAPSF
jgi:hypothetical protein